LEDGRGKDDEVPRGVWEAVETKAGKVRVAKAKGRRKEESSRKEMRRKE